MKMQGTYRGAEGGEEPTPLLCDPGSELQYDNEVAGARRAT